MKLPKLKKKLDVGPHNHPTRQAKNLRLKPEAIDMLRTLAEHYETTEGRLLEALLLNYGPDLLRQKKSRS